MLLTTFILFFYVFFSSFGFAAPVNLAPHRAVYDLSLIRVGGEKKIESASGRVALEFSGNACKGFEFISRQITNISNGEGLNKQVDTRVHNYENAKGTDLKFRSISRDGLQIINQSEGRAKRDQGGEVSISLHRPQLLKLDMDSKAVFPAAYTRQLIEAGIVENSFFSVKTYDGGEDGTKVFDTTAIIGKEIPAGSELRIDPIMNKLNMKNMRRWPVQVSYFEQEKGELMPVYRLSYDLFENGISASLMVDFGNLTLKGHLTHLDLLPAKACKND